MQRRLFGSRSAEVAEAIPAVASAVSRQGRFHEEEVLLREALAIRLALPAPQPRIPDIRNALGVSLARQRRYQEADAAYRAALEEYRRLDAKTAPDFSYVLNNLALNLTSQGQWSDAEALYRESLATGRRVYGDGHPVVAIALYNIGSLQRRQGRLAEAEATHREALAILLRAFGPEHSNVAMSRHALALVLRDAGRLREAEPLVREALAVLRKSGHGSRSTCMLTLGRLLLSTGRAAEAEGPVREALALRVAGDGEASAGADEARLGLGLWHLAKGRDDEALRLLVPALERLRGATEPDPSLLAEAEAARARLHSGR
jgi:tetratricopeptide (TPR) repeat protein